MSKKVNQYGAHSLDDFDIKSVVNVLRNKNLTSGDDVTKFEKLNQNMQLLVQMEPLLCIYQF